MDNSNDRHDVDIFITGFKERYHAILNFNRWVRGIEELPAFRHVVAEYLRHDTPEEAEQKTRGLVMHLFLLGHRIEFAPYGRDVSWDRKWNESTKQWEDKKLQLAQLLRQAADLFDSGQCDPGMHPSLTEDVQDGAKVPEWILEWNGFPPMDVDYWCGSERLRVWAKIIDMTPLRVVFPVARPDGGITEPSQNIGTRGGAANLESALRAMIIREIAPHVPETTSERFSTIANLAERIGLKKAYPHYVRSLLKKGRT